VDPLPGRGGALGVVRTIAGGCVCGRDPGEKHPIATPRPDAFARESPPVPRSGGGRIGPPGAGRKREAGPPTGEIMGDRPPESALLRVGEGVGAGERREGNPFAGRGGAFPVVRTIAGGGV